MESACGRRHDPRTIPPQKAQLISAVPIHCSTQDDHFLPPFFNFFSFSSGQTILLSCDV
jgi:hypothetical protein